MTATRAIADRDGFWIALSLLVRLPLLVLPAAGRDEATYHAWAAFDHGGYAPLMLSTVRVAEAAGLPPLVAVRTAAMLAGCALVWVVRHHLRVVSAPRSWQLWLSAALVCSPWFAYGGAILHPDPFLVTCMVASITAWALARPGSAAAWAVAAALAKPSGVVMALTMALLLARDAVTRVPLARSAAAALVAAGGAMVTLLILGPERAGALGDFARIDGSSPVITRAALLLGSVGVAAGPLLAVLAVRGALAGTPTGETARRARTAAIATAVVWCAVLLAAWVFRGQFKASWWMPAFLLLATIPAGSANAVFGVVAGRALTAGAAMIVFVFGAVFARPDLLDGIERRLGVGGTYALGAGHRESQVSATGSWSERVREYHDASGFVDDVRAWWGNGRAPERIVTDDYGLAAQLAFAWKPGRIVLDVPDDRIQPRPRPGRIAGPRLWLWHSGTWAEGRTLPPVVSRVAHPVARGESVWVAREP